MKRNTKEETRKKKHNDTRIARNTANEQRNVANTALTFIADAGSCCPVLCATVQTKLLAVAACRSVGHCAIDDVALVEAGGAAADPLIDDTLGGLGGQVPNDEFIP